MNKTVERNYLEINFLEDLKKTSNFSEKYSVTLVNPVDFQLNKFFYKNIGKNHHWVDRLVWTEKQWIDYASCLLYTSPSPRDMRRSRMPSSA